MSFSEFRSTCEDLPFDDAWREYVTYGGLPYCALLPTREEKADYLKHLFDEVFVRDIVERHKLHNDAELESLLNIVSSAVGSLTNPRKLEDTFASSGMGKLSATPSSSIWIICAMLSCWNRLYDMTLRARSISPLHINIISPTRVCVMRA